MSTDPLNMKSLPAVEPPEGLWTAIAEELDAPARDETLDTQARRRPRRFPPPMALAASLATVALCAALVHRAIEAPPDDAGAALPTELAASPADDATATEQLAGLQQLSGALEAELQRNRGGVLSARTADALARIEQQLAWLDAQLADAPADAALWTERVALLDEMNRRYRAADQRAGVLLASY